MSRLEFADISHYDNSRQPTGRIDFVKAVSSGFPVFWIKASEGSGWVDNKFEMNWQEAAAAGALVGSYHFFRCNFSGYDQAMHHLEVTQQMREFLGPKMLPPMLDFETIDGQTKETITSRLRDAAVTLKEHLQPLNKTPAVYTSPYIWNNWTTRPNWINNYIKWVAYWTGTVNPPGLPIGWSSWDLWQYGVYGQHSWVKTPIPGIAGIHDRDRAFGDLAWLKEICAVPDDQIEPPPPDLGAVWEAISNLDKRLDVVEQQIVSLGNFDSLAEEAITAQDQRLQELEQIRQQLKGII